MPSAVRGPMGEPKQDPARTALTPDDSGVQRRVGARYRILLTGRGSGMAAVSVWASADCWLKGSVSAWRAVSPQLLCAQAADSSVGCSLHLCTCLWQVRSIEHLLVGKRPHVFVARRA